jgi:hypothetical protein
VPLTLSHDRSDTASAAIREVCRKAQEASLAPDTEAAKRALNAVWQAVHKAQDTINTVERETRRDALANLERVA